ncbi:MAG: OmpA family protein [Crocinitomicaceae bacterium]|nr:OmpA family protein [Crocinitomicaceae bacterium]
MIKQFLFASFTLLSSITISQEYETITDEFDGNKYNWETGETSDVTAKIEGGKYIIKNINSKYLQSLTSDLAIDPNYDYTVETKIMQKEGSDGHGFGVVLGFYNWDNYATVQISSQGYFKVEYVKSKETTELVKAKKLNDGIVRPMNQWNILKIDKKGKQVKIYVNDNLVATLDDHLLFVGQSFGYFVSEVIKMEVEYLKITRRKMVMDVVQYPTKGDKLENLGSGVNSKYSELNPLISVDNKTIYYAIKNNPDMNIGEDLLLDAAYSTKDANGNWTGTKLVEGPVNNKHHNYMISISPDENSALFGNTYEEGGGSNIGVSYGVKRNGKWQKPETMEIKDFKNLSNYTEYCLSPDGMTILIAYESEDTYGGRDIYVSFLQDDGTWSKPKNCGPTINSYGIEMTPFIAADGKTLFFSSYGHPGYGSADVFISKRLDDTWTNWSKPKNAGNVINSSNFDAYFKIDAQGIYGYMVSSNNSIGMEDIYRIQIGEGLKPDILNLIAGKVYNAKTNEIIDAAIEYEDLSEGKKLGIAYSTSENGYKIALPKGKQYGFRASAEGFISVSNNIDLTNITKYEEKEVNLYLVPIESGQSLTLNNLFFDSGKSTLKKESFSELNRLAKVMKDNGSMKIEISGHTDSDGDEQKNLTLSQNRAKAVKDYLITKGVSTDNLKSVGFGEKNPKASNDTPEGKAMNRRVEMKIL